MDLPRALLGLAHLMLGAALAVAFTLLAIALMSPLLRPGSDLPPVVLVPAGTTIGVLLVLAVGVLPAVRRVQGVAAESMLGVVFDGGTPTAAARWPDRVRSVAWLGVHLVAGALLVAVLVSVPALALEVEGWLAAPALLASLGGGLLLLPVLRALAPVLLGPSPAERIASLEHEARELGQRNRLAREIHDSVGHALSLVTVQAAAARRVHDRDPAFVAEALAAIEDAGRRASAELDHVLGLLRRDDGGADRRAPAPGLGALPDLVAATTRAGLPTTVEVDVGDDAAGLSPVAGRELYRVVQESLANALRHGSAPCHVRLWRDGGVVRLEVSSGLGAGPGPRRRSGGRGLPGMTERVRALGGDLDAGPAGGRYAVRVRLPWVAAR